MIRNLVSRTPESVVALVGEADYRAYFGLLTSPRNRKNIAQAVGYGAPWAADNDAYGYWTRGEAYDPAPLLRALAQWRPYASTCLFVNAPDVLTNAKATLEIFWYWREIIRAYGYPVAFVVQNGVETYPPPWGFFDALFIGGTNATKYSRHVAGLIAEANRRGLHVHVGRVNTARTVRYCAAHGVDSFDGTKYTHDMTFAVSRTLPHQKQVLEPFLFTLEDVG